MTTQVKPQSKTVSANGHTLHYLDWGNVGKPVALLVHGLRGHAHSWDDVSAALCDDFHVLALDQRGRGDSDWAKDGDYTPTPTWPTWPVSARPWAWTSSSW